MTIADNRRRFRRYFWLDGFPDFLHNFAVAVGGWLAGWAILRISSSILIFANDLARESLVSRLYPMWWAIGMLLPAWFAWWCLHLLADFMDFRLDSSRRLTSATRLATEHRSSNTSATTAEQSMSTNQKPAAGHTGKTPTKDDAPVVADWRDRMRAAQQAKDVDSILKIRAELELRWPEAKRRRLDLQLGKWFTRHFQVQLQRGKADQVLPQLERVAEIFVQYEQYKYFAEILPTIRESAALKAAILAEDNEAHPDSPESETSNGVAPIK